MAKRTDDYGNDDDDDFYAVYADVISPQVVACGLSPRAVTLVKDAARAVGVPLQVGHSNACASAHLLVTTSCSMSQQRHDRNSTIWEDDLNLHAYPFDWLRRRFDSLLWQRSGIIVSVLGARGGCGASTLAQVLALTSPGETLLVETARGGFGYGLHGFGLDSLDDVILLNADPWNPPLASDLRSGGTFIHCGVWCARAKPGVNLRELARGFDAIVVDGSVSDYDVRIWVVDAQITGRACLRKQMRSGDLVAIRGGPPFVAVEHSADGVIGMYGGNDGNHGDERAHFQEPRFHTDVLRVPRIGWAGSGLTGRKIAAQLAKSRVSRFGCRVWERIQVTHTEKQLPDE